MALNYVQLDEETRRLMVEEVTADIAEVRVFVSTRLSATGRAAYSSLLLSAMRSGTDSTLDKALSAFGMLNEFEMSQRKGVPYQKRVPANAASVLAEGEFNKYYVRAICRRAMENGRETVEVYRGRQSQQPRPESEQLVGTPLRAAELLNDLRSNTLTPDQLGILPQVNTGLTVRY